MCIRDSKYTVKGSQFCQPLLEFSGACAGCGETPYIKAVTQLYGDRMMIANATGCSSIWGASTPSTPYCKNAQGQGPAWANSLFEDNAEYGFGMLQASNKIRETIANYLTAIAETAPEAVKAAANKWIENKDDAEGSKAAAAELKAALEGYSVDDQVLADKLKFVKDNADHYVKKLSLIHILLSSKSWPFFRTQAKKAVEAAKVKAAVPSNRSLNFMLNLLAYGVMINDSTFFFKLK